MNKLSLLICFLSFYLFSSILMACDEVSPQDIQEKYQQWKSHNIESYQYNIVRRCFCSPDYLRELQITVNDGHVVEVIYEDSQQEADTKIFNQQLTIEQWYELALSSVSNENSRVEVSFSEDSVYPTRIFIDQHLRRADDEYSVVIKKLSYQ